jgi:hypothetical protein
MECGALAPLWFGRTKLRPDRKREQAPALQTRSATQQMLRYKNKKGGELVPAL